MHLKGSQRFRKILEGLKIEGRIETIQTDIGQNTKKNPGDLRLLAVTQAPSANAIVRNSQGE